jgi:NAD(P)-dependent dehydrogenase (short-subunit alcohol dehydrogenase family)
VHPGIIQTPMAAPLFTDTEQHPDRRRRAEAMIPMKRLGEPEDIGYCVLYLASDESKYVTGAEFVVDGGWSAV